MNWSLNEIAVAVHLAIGMWPACRSLRWIDLPPPVRLALAVGLLITWPVVFVWESIVWAHERGL